MMPGSSCPHIPRGLCICEPLRTAYQRGREDAANAVEVAWNEPMTRDAYDFADWPTITIAAARGDGEQT